jgi:hypothetical protein
LYINDLFSVDFISNIEYAKKSMAKVLDNRIGKLSTLLDSKKSQLIVKTE